MPKRQKQKEEEGPLHHIMLIGAGQAGQIILRDVERAKEPKGKVCCIIDDNPNKWGRYMESVPIVGGRDDILASAKKYKIDLSLWLFGTFHVAENDLSCLAGTDQHNVMQRTFLFLLFPCSFQKDKSV